MTSDTLADGEGRRRLAIFLPNLGGGGAERLRVSTARALAARGFQVSFVLMEAKGPFVEEARAEFEIVDLGVRRLRSALVPIRNYLRTVRPEGALVDIWPLTTLVALARLTLPSASTRLVFTEHNTLSQQYGGRGPIFLQMMAAALRLNARVGPVVAVSDGVAQDLARLTGRGQAEIIDNVVPPFDAMAAEVGRVEAEAAWGSEARPRILNVGSFKAQKNQQMLLEAFAGLQDHPEAQLLILGEGPLRPQLEAKARALEVEDRVHLPGFAANPSAYYASADVFAMPSNYEGLSIALLEAMSAGMRIVATDCPSGTAEVLRNGELGWLSPVGDANAFSANLAKALAAPHDGRRQRARADDFSPARAAERLEHLLFGETCHA